MSVNTKPDSCTASRSIGAVRRPPEPKNPLAMNLQGAVVPTPTTLAEWQYISKCCPCQGLCFSPSARSSRRIRRWPAETSRASTSSPGLGSHPSRAKSASVSVVRRAKVIAATAVPTRHCSWRSKRKSRTRCDDFRLSRGRGIAWPDLHRLSARAASVDLGHLGRGSARGVLVLHLMTAATGEKLSRRIDQQLADVRDDPKLVRSFFHAPAVVYIRDC